MKQATGWIDRAIDWRRAKDLFAELLEIDAPRRGTTLAERCGDDAALLETVERLLAAHDDATFLAGDGAGATAERIPDPAVGDRVGPCMLVERLGEGGFGVVFRARQVAPVEREVALKVLRSGLDDERVLRRFAVERDALARMEHPDVARVFDAGIDAAGRPYVVMELVRGRPVTEACRDRGADVAARVALAERICRAIHHAHQRAIIHRDVKPSNILVTEIDGAMQPRVIDFGIATATDRAASGEGRLGTPRSMSPEQLTGAAPADVRSDVYALGLVLCELVTGSLPRDPRAMAELAPGANAPEVAATPPSRLHRAAGRDAPRGAVGPELDAIVLKAVAWRPEDRYDSAAALADDLARLRRREPVLALGDGAAYRLRAFMRRHAVASTAAALATIALIAGTAIAWSGRRAAIDARDLADAEARRAAFTIEFLLDDMLAAVDPDVSRGRDVTVAELLDVASSEAQRRFADLPDLRAEVLATLGRAYERLSAETEAAALFEAALADAEAIDGPRSERVLELRADLAGVLFGTPDGHARAIALRGATRDDAVAALGPEHPVSLRARMQAAADIEDLVVATAELESIVTALERLGLEDGATGIAALRGLAFAYGRLGRDEDRLVALTLVAERAVGRYGAAHSLAIGARLRRAECLIDLGRLAEGEAALAEALDAARAIYPTGHSTLTGMLANAAQTLLAAQRSELAIALLREFEATVAGRDGIGSIQHANAQGLLGRALLQVGAWTEARLLLETALARKRVQWGDDHVQVGFTMRTLAEACLGAGDPEAALVHAHGAMERLTRQSRGGVAAAEVAARALDDLGRPEEAARIRAELDRAEPDRTAPSAGPG